MGLLAADLTALACLPRSAAGRRALSAAALGLGLFGWLSWWLAQTLLDHPGLVVGLHRASDGDSQRALFAYALSACPAVAAWLGLALAQRQLFAAPELPLWRTAPLPPWRPAMQALLRAGFASTGMALAIAGPGAVAVLARGPAPAWAYALVPLAVVAATVPSLAALLATQIVLVRFLVRTPPAPARQNRFGRVILGLLTGVVLGVGVAALLVMYGVVALGTLVPLAVVGGTILVGFVLGLLPRRMPAA